MEISVLEEGKKLVRASLTSLNQLSIVKNLRIATALLPDWNIFRKLRESGLFYSKIDFNGVPCVVIYQGLEFDAKPQPSKSAGSQAIYLARRDNGENSFLLQYLPPRSITSRHYHMLTTERFHSLEGSCEIEINGVGIPIKGQTLQVDPYQIHQVRTREQASLTLIEMLGNPNGLSMDDHYYVNYSQ